MSDLDSKMAYIQITHVVPYFIKDELETRQTEFEQNHDIDTFMFETPFTKNGTARCNLVEDQWKRRTILTSRKNYFLMKPNLNSFQYSQLNTASRTSLNASL